MSWINLIGYLAAVLMFTTFFMKKMIPLRAMGASANVTFIIYSAVLQVYPLLILHAALLPLNITRMIQMIMLVKKVRESATGDLSMDFLAPFMKKENFKKGDIVFRKDDTADKMYYLQNGTVKLEELGTFLTNGELIGEIGIFSRHKKRMATMVCETDTLLLTMTEGQVLQLYFQNPKFGFYLVQLIIHRLQKDLESARKSIDNLQPFI